MIISFNSSIGLVLHNREKWQPTLPFSHQHDMRSQVPLLFQLLQVYAGSEDPQFAS